jgi:HlyD family secretion protein
VLARIDPITFQARVDQLSASLNQAEADLGVVVADNARYERLAAEGYASDQLLQQQRAARARAEAAVAQVRAQLSSARADLERTVIRAPVDGVVVDRRVDPGQSVAASFQAPTLFVIAQDLSQLQAAIVVDEADIGEVREGLPVRFTVDAFPGEDFAGEVAQVRQQGATNQGVVTYTVMVRAANPGGRLLPGMTANAEIMIETRPDALRLPNAALRFRPGDPEVAALAESLEGAEGGQREGSQRNAGGQREGGGERGAQMVERVAEALDLSPEQTETFRQALRTARESAGSPPGPDAPQEERRAFMRRIMEQAYRALEPTLSPQQREALAELRANRGQARSRSAVVWVMREGAPQPVRVRLGVASDNQTEILEGLAEGDEVVIGGGPEREEDAPRPGQGGGPPGVRIRGA